MPPPDVTAKPAANVPSVMPQPAADVKDGAPAVNANPLWAIPLSALAATRNRPLFTPSRRPPAPVVANAPPPAPRPPPPPPAAPEHPDLVLVGTVAGQGEGVAVFIDKGTKSTVRLRTGEGHLGWILQSIERRTATLQKGGQTETLELPKPAEAQAAAPPVISPLPPPPPPPPQLLPAPPPGRPLFPPRPPPNPQQLQGCAPPPIGC
jgi:hypothetical protein